MQDTAQEIMTVVLSIISATTFSGLLSAGVIWLTKSWISERIKGAIQNEYQQKLETHKSELKANSDVELEKLRSELGRQSAERQFKFEKLNEKRAEVIAETYSRLVQFRKTISLTVEIPHQNLRVDKTERNKEIMTATNGFTSYFNRHQIYLPEQAVKQINTVFAHVIIAGAQSATSPLQIPSNVDEMTKVLDEFQKSSKPVTSALRELEAAFRILLGDEAKQATV